MHANTGLLQMLAETVQLCKGSLSEAKAVSTPSLDTASSFRYKIVGPWVCSMHSFPQNSAHKNSFKAVNSGNHQP